MRNNRPGAWFRSIWRSFQMGLYFMRMFDKYVPLFESREIANPLGVRSQGIPDLVFGSEQISSLYILSS